VGLDKLIFKSNVSGRVSVIKTDCGLGVHALDENLFVFVALLYDNFKLFRTIETTSFVKFNLNFALKLMCLHSYKFPDGVVRCRE
jgi:hypothetical protein